MAEEAESPTQIDNDELFERGLILAHELFSEQLINDQERDHLKGNQINAPLHPLVSFLPALPHGASNFGPLWAQTRPKFTKAATPLGPCPLSERRDVHRLPQQHC